MAYDFGVKQNILRRLVDVGCGHGRPSLDYGRRCAGALNPHGVFLNGPGDPEGVPYAMTALRELIGRLPILGFAWDISYSGSRWGSPPTS